MKFGGSDCYVGNISSTKFPSAPFGAFRKIHGVPSGLSAAVNKTLCYIKYPTVSLKPLKDSQSPVDRTNRNTSRQTNRSKDRQAHR